MLVFVFPVLVAIAAAAPNQAVLDLFQNTYQGDGTYYGNSIQGACSIGTPLPPAATDPKINALVALNSPQFMGSLTCGMCVKVTGSGSGSGSTPLSGTYIVFVKDLCPECAAGDVDFALDGDGRWDISIQAVQCPVGSTNIQYSFQGSNQWYVKLQIRNPRIPITQVELQRNGVWVTPVRTADGYWQLGDGTEWQTGGINVRMTAANGEVLNDVIPRIENDVIMDGAVQVAPDSSLPSA